MNIDPNTEQALAELAALKNVSVDTLLRDFAAKEKRYWQQRNADMASLETMKSGKSISHDGMKSHMQTLREMARERL